MGCRAVGLCLSVRRLPPFQCADYVEDMPYREYCYRAKQVKSSHIACRNRLSEICLNAYRHHADHLGNRLLDMEEDVRVAALKCIGETAMEDPAVLTEKLIIAACDRMKDKKVRRGIRADGTKVPSSYMDGNALGRNAYVHFKPSFTLLQLHVRQEAMEQLTRAYVHVLSR